MTSDAENNFRETIHSIIGRLLSGEMRIELSQLLDELKVDLQFRELFVDVNAQQSVDRFLLAVEVLNDLVNADSSIQNYKDAAQHFPHAWQELCESGLAVREHVASGCAFKN